MASTSRAAGVGGRGGGGLRSSLGRVIAETRTRQLQVATGGKFKYLVLSKITNYLKKEFLEGREKRPTLAQILEKINESRISDGVKDWLEDEELPKHPRVRVVTYQNSQKESGCPRYAYDPPLKNCASQGALLKLLQKMHEGQQGGLQRSLVEDSDMLADRYIENLLKEDKIIQVTGLDKSKVLFFKAPEPELEKCVADNRFIELWRKVDVCNKEMSHIKTYLKKQGLSVFDDDKLDNRAQREKRKAEEELAKAAKALAPKPKRRRKSTRKLKDNAHVQEKMMHFDENM